MAANITIAFRKGEASPESDDLDWGVRRYIDKLFVHFGPGLTLMFDDPQEGMDLLNSFVTVPPTELGSTVDPKLTEHLIHVHGFDPEDASDSRWLGTQQKAMEMHHEEDHNSDYVGHTLDNIGHILVDPNQLTLEV